MIKNAAAYSRAVTAAAAMFLRPAGMGNPFPKEVG